LGLSSYKIENVLRTCPEKIQILKFRVGGSKNSKKLHSLYKAGTILTLKNDPRIIDYTASKINMKVQIAPEARSMV